MNLLPKNNADFAHPKYWNKFFRKRGQKEFEWYGKLADLYGLLQKYLRSQDAILVIGCGNSQLSLGLYDFGYKNITNIDISPVVISQMRKKIGNQRPGMIFEEMDALNMSYDKGTFSVVLDKGTLDALMPSDSKEDELRIERLFSEVSRVLSENGRYIIVSLLQEHILKAILNYFTKHGWIINIIRCRDVEKQGISKTGFLVLPVFMILCVKLKNPVNNEPALKVNLFIDDKFESVKSGEEVIMMIKEVQKSFFHFKEAKGEMELTFCKRGDENPRYTIYITDASQDYRKLLKYAAFIVPLGRETEWMFGTADGRSCLRQSTGFDRLAVIVFHRNQRYGTLMEVQDELRRSVLQLAPPLMIVSSETNNIPYLSLGEGIGRRVTVYSGVSELSGEILVEDVEIGEETFRRLVFTSNQAVVQSEVKLIETKPRHHDANRATDDGEIDSSYVGHHHSVYMSIGASANAKNLSPKSVAVVGVGGGSLCLLLRNLYPAVSVVGVEIDPVVVRLAQRYFGLKTDDRLKIVIKDGVEFLKEKNKFDVIMFDVDSKEKGCALTCPPHRFVESSVLAAVAESLGEQGVFVTNVVTRKDSEQKKLIRKIREHFHLLCWCNLKEDVNRIIFATNAQGKTETEWQNEIKENASLLKPILEEKVKFDGGSLDLSHFMTGLAINDE